MRNGFLLIFLLAWQLVMAQNTSNKGKDFWVAYAAHIDAQKSQMSLYITSTLSTKGVVSIPGQNYSVSYTVMPNSVTVVDIPANTAYIGSSETVEAKAIRVTAEDDVVVYAHIYSQNRSGATLVLPTGALGREYYTIGYNQNTPKQSAQFMIVATDDNTLVEITPIAATKGGRPANVPFTVTLMKGDAYQVQSDTDLTGSMVRSVSGGTTTCKRIAVFSGSSFTPLGCPEATTGDNLIQQLYPASAWGSVYITAPLATRIGGDIFRVLSASDGTTIKLNDTLLVRLDKGQFFEFESDTSNFLTSTAPVMLAQYPRSQGCDKVTGDPEMIILTPVEQTLKDITLYSSPYYKITGHYINIFMKTAGTGSFTIDGQPAQFTPVAGNPEYSYSRITVAMGNHRLKADSGFNALAYGFGNVESYGYSAGANIKNLNHYITFSSETYCEGETATFSGFASYVPKSWKWYFGDGSVSTEENPSHRYEGPGKYIVSLVTTRENGYDCDSQDSTSAELTVYPNPQTAFSFQNHCEGDTTAFEDLSSSAFNGNDIVLWQWDFGDGSQSTERHPKRRYDATGSYMVTLQTTTAFGCASSASMEVKVHPLPQPEFTAEPVCEFSATVFADQSVIAEGEIMGWEWNFGDSVLSTVQNPVYAYKNSGTYQPVLRAISRMGCTKVIQKEVTVYPMPRVSMDLPPICIRDEAHFTNTSVINSGTMDFNWEFGDGGVSNDIHPNHKYLSEGVYKVKLFVVSDFGCETSVEEDYTVSGAEPIAALGYSDTCHIDGVKFSDSSTIAFGNIVRWEWDFGDGATSSIQHPEHFYPAPGSYTVNLKVYSGIVCKDEITKTIEILSSPDALFSTADVCISSQAVFQNNSGISDGQTLHYEWDFGDGQISGEANPERFYSQPGGYNVALTAIAMNGCRDVFATGITIHPDPQPWFQPDKTCLAGMTQFKNESLVSSGIIVSSSWDFGDGAGSPESQPVHSFPHAGLFPVRLEVITDKGCRATAVREVDVKPVPVALAGTDQSPVCGVTMTRLAANEPKPALGFWTVISGEGGTFSDFNNPQAKFSGLMGESYTLRWRVQNSPCADSVDDVAVKFSPLPQVDAGPDAWIIEGESVTLSGFGEGVLSWSPAFSLDNPKTAAPVASPVETTIYTLSAESADGCVDTSLTTVKVLRRLRIPTGISPNDDGINDVWLLDGVEDYPDISVRVFNRWGNEVFNSTGYTSPWDGTKNGQPLSDGVYYYMINIHRNRDLFRGSVTVLR